MQCLQKTGEGYLPPLPPRLASPRGSLHAGIPATPISSCVYFITCGHPRGGVTRFKPILCPALGRPLFFSSLYPSLRPYLIASLLPDLSDCASRVAEYETRATDHGSLSVHSASATKIISGELSPSGDRSKSPYTALTRNPHRASKCSTSYRKK
jgi:hypothetical protein